MNRKAEYFLPEQIYRAIWHVETIGVEENVIAVHIRRIRMKIEHDPKKAALCKGCMGCRLQSRLNFTAKEEKCYG